MDLGIAGKKALVTGGSRGIGKAICNSLQREGVEVVAVARSFDSHENGITCVELDLSLSGFQENLLNSLNAIDFMPDILVHNVGGNLGVTDPLCTIEEWHRVMQFNVDIPVALNRLFIPHLVKNKWGRICHISSIAGLENQGPPAYCAAKAALIAYARSLGRFVSKDNVCINTVLPGAVFTEGGYWDQAQRKRPEHVEKYLRERMAIQRFGTTKEISELVTVLCSEIASFVIGSSLLVDGGQGRVFFDQSEN